MRNPIRIAICVAVALAPCCIAQAQTSSSGSSTIPRVMQITREFVKPGKTGNAHDKAESAFVRAMEKANWPTYYFALSTLTGRQRVLFLTEYPSFDAWEKDGKATQKNETLSAALDRAAEADGELLSEMDQSVFVFDEDMSLNPRPDLSHMRFMEVSLYHVRPGHEAEWKEVVSMVKAAYQKGIPDAHWGLFRQMFGGEGQAYLVLTAHPSLDEIDKDLMNDKKFAAAMGEEGMKKLDNLFGSAVDVYQHNLFAFSPRMSYPPRDWVKADPDFWTPKPMPDEKKH